MEPLVSVIMTTYNCSKYIEESIMSIVNQTFKDFELIIFNDSSTDNTVDIINGILNNFNGRYTFVNRIIGENVGCGEGRNIAIEKAKGKYIAIQDADDISMEDRLEKEVNFLEHNADIFCVGAWAKKVTEKGDYMESMDYPPKYHGEIYNEIMRKKNNPIIDPSSMYRRKDFNQLGGYDSRWRLVPDFNLWIRAIKKGYKFSNLQEILIYYRQHPNSVTNKNEMDVVREHFLMCRELF